MWPGDTLWIQIRDMKGCVKTDLHRSHCHCPVHFSPFLKKKKKRVLGEALWKSTVQLHYRVWITVPRVQIEPSFHSCCCEFTNNKMCVTQIDCTTLLLLINNLETITEIEASHIVLCRVFPSTIVCECILSGVLFLEHGKLASQTFD